MGVFIQCASRGARRACATRRAYTRYSRCASLPTLVFPHTYVSRTRTLLHLRIWTLYSSRSLSRGCPRTNGTRTRRSTAHRRGVCDHVHRYSRSRTNARRSEEKENVRAAGGGGLRRPWKGRYAYVGPRRRGGRVRCERPRVTELHERRPHAASSSSCRVLEYARVF